MMANHRKKFLARSFSAYFSREVLADAPGQAGAAPMEMDHRKRALEADDEAGQRRILPRTTSSSLAPRLSSPQASTSGQAASSMQASSSGQASSSMQGSSSLARKRPAEPGIEEFEYSVVNGHVDDDVQIAEGLLGAAARPSGPSADLHLSFLKASLVPQLQRGLEDHFRQQEVDVGAFDLKQMAFDAASMGVVTNGNISTNDKLSSIIAGENGFFASLFETWDIQNPEDLKLLATVQERDDPYMLYGAPPGEVFNALMGGAVAGGQAGKARDDFDVATAERAADCDEVVGAACGENAIGGAERDKPSAGQSGGDADHVLFGHTDVKKSIRERLFERENIGVFA